MGHPRWILLAAALALAACGGGNAAGGPDGGGGPDGALADVAPDPGTGDTGGRDVAEDPAAPDDAKDGADGTAPDGAPPGDPGPADVPVDVPPDPADAGTDAAADAATDAAPDAPADAPADAQTDVPADAQTDAPDAPACPVPDAIAHLPLADRAGGRFPDRTGNGHDGEAVGPVGTAGGTLPGASLAGRSFVRLAAADRLPRTAAGTVALRVRVPPPGRPGVLFARADVLDLDRDGRLDLWASNNYDDATQYATDSFVWWNRADGFAPEPSRIPTWGAAGAAFADLDGDGWLDLVLAHDATKVAEGWRTNVYRGSPAGLRPDPDGLLNPRSGAVALADLDGDGWWDAVFGRDADDETGARVVFGAPGGFDRGRTLHLPAGSPGGLEVLDPDRDGRPDLLVTSLLGSASEPSESFLFLNGSEGLRADVRRALPTDSCYGGAAGDLDRDGFADLVLGSYWDTEGTATVLDDHYDVDSWIVPGTAQGFDAAARRPLPSFGAVDPAVADLDDDGWPEVLVPNYYDGHKGPDGRPDKPLEAPARVYRGSPEGFDPERRIDLPAHGCNGMAVGDLDGDDRPEVVVPSPWDGTRHDLDVHVHAGTALGPDPAAFRALPGRGTGTVSLPGTPYCGASTVAGAQPCRHGALRLSVHPDGTGGARLEAELHDARGRPHRLGAPLPADRWVDVALAWDGTAGTATLWVDGAPAARLAAVLPWGDTFPWRARLGADVEGGDGLSGDLAHLRLFDRALTDAEAACLAAGAR